MEESPLGSTSLPDVNYGNSTNNTDNNQGDSFNNQDQAAQELNQ